MYIYTNVGHCSWETFDNCGCHGWMIENVTQTEIVTIDAGCFCGAGLDLKRKNFLSWQCRSPTCIRRNVVQYLLTMLHILEMMKNAKIMLMRIQKLAKRFWWRNLSHKNADTLFLPDADVFTSRMSTCYSLTRVLSTYAWWQYYITDPAPKEVADIHVSHMTDSNHSGTLRPVLLIRYHCILPCPSNSVPSIHRCYHYIANYRTGKDIGIYISMITVHNNFWHLPSPPSLFFPFQCGIFLPPLKPSIWSF